MKFVLGSDFSENLAITVKFTVHIVGSYNLLHLSRMKYVVHSVFYTCII